MVQFLDQEDPLIEDLLPTTEFLGFSGGSDGKESARNAGDLGSIRTGRSPEEGNGYPFQYSGLENSMDRGAWQTTVHGVTKSWTQLSNFNFHALCSIASN